MGQELLPPAAARSRREGRMNLAPRIDFPTLMEPVALRLLGEPNPRLSKPPRDVRFGNHGSMAVDYENGRWFDHENKVGGGVLDLIRHKRECDASGATDWLRGEGLLPDGWTSGAGQSSAAKGPEAARIVDTYDYVDERGALLHQTVRFEAKTFKQRRPDPDDAARWIWNLQGIRTVLYRLPELLSATANGDIIYVTEGEKDADNMRALGLTATTNPMGAGKWRTEYSDHLRSADVVILSDNDQAGRHHVQQVASSLNGFATRVRTLDIRSIWPECPEKGDISDWIAAGGDADVLKNAVEALPDWKPESGSNRSNPAEPTERREPSPYFASYASFAWPVIDKAAYHGIAGKIVQTILPHTEADPIALLIQTLGMAGNVIGRLPYYQVESDQHRVNLFAVLVGDSAKGRKGTSLGRIRSIVKVADETWSGDRIKGGLSSGEGFINEVRDPVQKYNAKEKSFEIVDPGVADKRLMIVEPEFAGAISVAERHGNTLSPLIRRAWDGDKLATLTRNSPLSATGAHISIVGHITIDELRARISRTEMGNGFANRFLFALIRRSKELPFGGDLTDSQILHLGEQLKSAIDGAKSVDRMEMTDAARSKWAAVYPELSAAKPGLLGAVIARAEAQTVRVALIYALLDGADKIDLPHLEAALAVWEYCELSAVHIFGGAIGDPVADEILRALQNTADGMTRTAINDLFGRHQSSNRIAAALQLLATKGRARPEMRQTSGRPSEIWFATGR
jgi:5S rRNA maturation endonuclease (ribonuclease M5)